MKEYTLQHIKKIATMKKEQPETKKEAAPVADYLNWWNGLKELQKNEAMDKANIDQRIRANQLNDGEILKVYLEHHPNTSRLKAIKKVDNLDWNLYPGNEAGAFDHLDDAANPTNNEDKASFALIPELHEGLKDEKFVYVEIDEQTEKDANEFANGYVDKVAAFMGYIEATKIDRRKQIQLKNNHDAMYRALKELAKVVEHVTSSLEQFEGNSELLYEPISKAKALLNSINKQ